MARKHTLAPMMKRLLLFGASGQLGQALWDTLHTHYHITLPSKDSCNFLEEREVLRWIQYAQADLIVNAAAFTDVDRAEAFAEEVNQINAYTPACIAQYAQKRQCPFIHFSTDYVFNGQNKYAYLPHDPTEPINQYGHSKALSETLVLQYNTSRIFRLSALFSDHPEQRVDTLLQALIRNQKLAMVIDQITTPTAVDTVAYITAQILCRLHHIPHGLYHLASSPACSWYQFAQHIERYYSEHQGKKQPSLIEPVLYHHYQRKAQRPRYSALNSHQLSQTLNLSIPRWPPRLKAIVANLCSTTSKKTSYAHQS